MKRERILVVAGSHRQAREYAEGQGWVPVDWRSMCHALVGDHYRAVHFTGTWRNLKKAAEIKDCALDSLEIGGEVVGLPEPGA